MRYRAEFQSYSSGTDKDGFVTKRWWTVFSVWADVTAVSSREYLAANTETAETTVKIFVRYNPKIDNTMRVVCGEIAYEITSVLHDRRGNITTVMAKEWRQFPKKEDALEKGVGGSGKDDVKTSRGDDEKAGAAGYGV